MYISISRCGTLLRCPKQELTLQFTILRNKPLSNPYSCTARTPFLVFVCQIQRAGGYTGPCAPRNANGVLHKPSTVVVPLKVFPIHPKVRNDMKLVVHASKVPVTELRRHCHPTPWKSTITALPSHNFRWGITIISLISCELNLSLLNETPNVAFLLLASKNKLTQHRMSTVKRPDFIVFSGSKEYGLIIDKYQSQHTPRSSPELTPCFREKTTAPQRWPVNYLTLWSWAYSRGHCPWGSLNI
jgi:hypothetical protein